MWFEGRSGCDGPPPSMAGPGAFLPWVTTRRQLRGTNFIDNPCGTDEFVLVNLRSPGFLCGVLLLLLSDGFSLLDAQPFWPQFRGPNGQGVAESAHPPTTFSPSENAVWSAEVPPGHSSPCIWGKRIFLSTFQDGGLQCRAYDRANGKLLW